MSLKAQIEAIIYAAEDPVTLDQLATLLKEQIIHLEQLGPEGVPTDISPREGLTLAEGADADGTTPATEPVPQDPSAESAGGEPSPSNEAVDAQGELLNPKRAQREETKRHKDLILTAVDELVAEYASSDRGIEVREVAGGYRMSTKPEHHDLVRTFAKGMKPPIKLSLPALETLAVIAYKQPVTAPEISEIRGVDTSGVLSSLLGRKLITTAGRKQVVGRPILYKTTKEFLVRFGLKDVNELPSMEEFEKLSAQSDMFDTSVTDAASEAMTDPPEEPVAESCAIPEDYAESATEPPG